MRILGPPQIEQHADAAVGALRRLAHHLPGAALRSATVPCEALRRATSSAGLHHLRRAPRGRRWPARGWRRSWCVAGIAGQLGLRALLRARPRPAASCLRRTRGRRRRRSRCRRCRPRRRTSRSPRAYRRRRRARTPCCARSPGRSARVPSPNCSNSNTPTGPFQMMVPADLQQPLQTLGGVRADVEDHLVAGAPRAPGARRRARWRRTPRATTTSVGSGISAPRARACVQQPRAPRRASPSRTATCRRRRRSPPGRCWRCRRRRSACRPCRAAPRAP